MEMVKHDNRRQLSAKVSKKLHVGCYLFFRFISVKFVEDVASLHTIALVLKVLHVSI